jgi:hypothetical protein
MRKTTGLFSIALLVSGLGCSSGSGTPYASTSTTTTVPDAAAGGGDGGLLHIDRSHLSDAGTSGTLDYSDPSLWVCRPGIDQNPCYGDLDATEILPDGGQQVLKHTRATDPKFDCFYVYPTVDLTMNGNMTNLSDTGVKLVLDPLLAQAARFSEQCEIYAPLYRQIAFTPTSITPPPATDAGATDAGATDAGSSGVSGLMAAPGAALALGDVRAAFKYYLDHFNKGRKFVIMGHSQGSGMLQAMMQTDVDPMPQLRGQMISAILLGGGATVAPGSDVNGTFKNIPTCTKPTDTGCLISYSSYDVAKPPGANALFGKSPDGNMVACTNPGPLVNNSGPYHGSYFPTTVNNPSFNPDQAPPKVGTPFVLYRDMFQGNCVVKNGYSYLEITFLGQSSDPRGTPPYQNSGAESIGFGLHLVDYNLPLEELLGVVKQQAAIAVK